MKKLSILPNILGYCLIIIVSHLISAQSYGAELGLQANTKQKALLGEKRPSFSLPDINGTQRSVDEWNGKVLIINFWASWCTPCRKEITVFNQLQNEYGADDVTFVGIAIDHRNAVKQFMESIPINYPVLIGNAAAIKLAKKYGNFTGSLPYSVFINRKGKISSIISGGLNEKITRRTIEKLL